VLTSAAGLLRQKMMGWIKSVLIRLVLALRLRSQTFMTDGSLAS
jgi:hypothetical protein